MSGLSKNESSQAMQNLFSAYEDADESKAEVNISDDEEFSDYSETPTGSKSTEKSVEKTTGEKSDQDERQNLDEPEVKKPKLESRGIQKFWLLLLFCKSVIIFMAWDNI